MKRIFIIALVFSFSFFLTSKEFDISKIKFSGLDIKSLSDESSYEISSCYNIAYSAILPADAIYIAEDTVTGKEAIIQISPVSVDAPPYTIYLTEKQFQFFTSTYEKSVDFLTLNLKFLGWNKKINNYSKRPKIITPDESYDQILKNSDDSLYIQLGSFSHYQNGYPLITELLDSLSLLPSFYIVKSKINDRYVYKILAGPYSKDDASNIIVNNNLKEVKMFIRNYSSIIEDIKSGMEIGME